MEASDLRGGSGFRGDEARWERARRPIVSAIDRNWTFLDVGCANGLLMECITAWAAEDGFEIEPYGLDLMDSLAAPPEHRQEMVEHLLRDYLVQEGCLIVCSYGSSRRAAPKARRCGPARLGHAVDGEAEGLDTNGVVFTRVAWTTQQAET